MVAQEHSSETNKDAMNEKRNNSEAGAHADDQPQSREDQPAVELSDEAADLVREIERERDEAIEARKRALADFQNYQRRASENERRALEEGMTRIVRSILPVLDHFDLALTQGQEPMTVEQLIGGVKIVRDELDKTLQSHGVERIEPNAGDQFEPQRHEAMTHEPSDEIEPGSVVKVYQSGYMMGERVLRPAKVAVASSKQDNAQQDDGSRAEE